MIIPLKDVVVEVVTITVPLWVNWIAVDKRGSAWGYECRPDKDDSWWLESDENQEPSQYLFRAEINEHENWENLIFNVGGE